MFWSSYSMCRRPNTQFLIQTPARDAHTDKELMHACKYMHLSRILLLDTCKSDTSLQVCCCIPASAKLQLVAWSWIQNRHAKPRLLSLSKNTNPETLKTMSNLKKCSRHTFTYTLPCVLSDGKLIQITSSYLCAFHSIHPVEVTNYWVNMQSHLAKIAFRHTKTYT